MKFFFFLFLISFCSDSNTNKLKQAISDKDYLKVASLCSEYKFEKFEKECNQGIEDSVIEIEKIISQKRNLPFMKIILDKEKARKIDSILKYNIQLGIKYRSIWYETAEQYRE